MKRPKIRLVVILFSLSVTILLLSLPTIGVAQKKMDRIDRERLMSILKNVRNTIKKEYYDETFRGMDIDTRFATAEERLKQAETLGQGFGIIAQAVVDLNDSHTRFNPPARNAIVDYGWRMKMFGDKAFVTYVKEKSDAEKKGLKVGDEVMALNRFPPSRTEMWKMIYFYRQLNPQTQLTLTVKSPDGEPRELTIEAKITELKVVVDLTRDMDFNEAVREGSKLRNAQKHYFKSFGGVVIWKMPSFVFDPAEVSGMVSSNVSGKQTLILDLRSNPGGYVVTLEKLAGYFFDQDVKIADLKGRKPMKPQMAKSEGDKAFKGKLIVLIDSGSGSAAEIFARLVQLEKRGIVLGDVSAGAVMQSRGYSLDAGSSTMIRYGVSVTNADVIMSDGNSLEHVGVQPDEKIIPTAADLFAGRDPVLARALELAGISLDAAQAGKIFPLEKEIDLRTNVPVLIEF